MWDGHKSSNRTVLSFRVSYFSVMFDSSIWVFLSPWATSLFGTVLAAEFELETQPWRLFKRTNMRGMGQDPHQWICSTQQIPSRLFRGNGCKYHLCCIYHILKTYKTSLNALDGKSGSQRCLRNVCQITFAESPRCKCTISHTACAHRHDS